jgi:hypothetical protein
MLTHVNEETLEWTDTSKGGTPLEVTQSVVVPGVLSTLAIEELTQGGNSRLEYLLDEVIPVHLRLPL